MHFSHNLRNNTQTFLNQQLGLSKWSYCNEALSRPQGTPLFDNDTLGEDDVIFTCKFAEKQGYEHILALAREKGSLIISNTNNTDSDITQVHQNAIFDLAWLHDSYKLITVSGDNTARLLDLESGVRVEQVFTGHTRSVKTIAVGKTDASIFATGSRDGSIRLWDTRACFSTNLIVNSDRTISNSHYKNTPTSAKKKGGSGYTPPAISVTGLVFQNDNVLISCGSGDGNIKVWDLRKSYNVGKRIPAALHTLPYSGGSGKNGYSNLLIDKWGLKLYANCLDNSIYCYNIGTYSHQPVMEYRGFVNNTFYIKSVLSPCGNYLLSGSSDDNAYIWNLNYKYPIVQLSGHVTEVTSVGWRDKCDTTLVTCSDDIACIIWRAPDRNATTLNEVGCVGKIKTITSLNRIVAANESTPKQSQLEPCLKRPFVDATNFQNKRRRLFNALPSREEEALADLLEATTTSEAPLCKKAKYEQVSPSDLFSPTSNLPNFVVDGSAPHLHFSPQKRQDKDWLTKLRVERKLVRNMQELAEGGGGGSPAKMKKLEECVTPRSNKANKRRNSRCNSPHSPLLRFFRITNNSIMKDTQCSPKSLLNNSPKENMKTTD